MNIKMLIAVSALALFTHTGSAELNLELPENILSSGSESTFNGIPVNFSNIGIKRLRAVRKRARVIEDPEINEWIRSIGRRLVAQTSYSNRPFYFVVVRDDSVNAFATQGGLIVINSGLILQSASESELAAVMAHEIAHVTQQHIERMIADSKNSRLGNTAALVAGLLVGSKDATAGQAIVASAMAVDAHKSLRFGRAAETEADREGLRILAKARYDPNGMTRFLRKLGGVNARYSGIAEYLSSHPLTTNRVSDVGQRARLYGVYKGAPSPDYFYMQEKLRVMTRQSVVNRQLPLLVRNYGNALKAFQQGKAAQTIGLLAKQKRSVHEALLLANSFNQQRQYEKAVAVLQPFVANRGYEESVLMTMASGLLGLKRPKEAWALLNRVQLHEQTSLEFLGVRQEVAQAAGRTGQAYLSIAERNIRIGLYTPALIQLTQARKVANLTLAERQAIEQATYRAQQFKKR